MSERLEAARKRYANVYQSYEEIAQALVREIRHGAIYKNLDCVVEGRAKDVGSFVLKAAKDPNIVDPWAEVYDKIGIRIIVSHVYELDLACELLTELFGDPVHLTDDRDVDYPENELRYPRLHLQMTVPSELDASKQTEGLPTCEIQVRTEASHLWSKLSHTYLYKPLARLPKSVIRSLYRLLALVELYDSEVKRAVDAMRADPDREVNMLVSQLQRIFYAFCVAEYDIDLTRRISSTIMQAVRDSDRAAYPKLLAAFAKEHRSALEDTFKQYGPGSPPAKQGTYVLVGQPECIAIFERLRSAPIALSAVWSEEGLPDEFLEDLRNIWGERS